MSCCEQAWFGRVPVCCRPRQVGGLNAYVSFYGRTVLMMCDYGTFNGGCEE